MSEARRPKRSSPSDPRVLQARVEKAHAEGKPVEIDDDEVTGVIDIVLQKVRAASDASQQKVRELARAIDSVDPKRT